MRLPHRGDPKGLGRATQEMQEVPREAGKDFLADELSAQRVRLVRDGLFEQADDERWEDGERYRQEREEI